MFFIFFFYFWVLRKSDLRTFYLLETIEKLSKLNTFRIRFQECTLMIRLKVQGYRRKSDIAIFAWNDTCNYGYCSFMMGHPGLYEELHLPEINWKLIIDLFFPSPLHQNTGQTNVPYMTGLTWPWPYRTVAYRTCLIFRPRWIGIYHTVHIQVSNIFLVKEFKFLPQTLIF